MEVIGVCFYVQHFNVERLTYFVYFASEERHYLGFNECISSVISHTEQSGIEAHTLNKPLCSVDIS